MDNQIRPIVSDPLQTSGRLKEIEVEVNYLSHQTTENFIKMGKLLKEAKEEVFGNAEERRTFLNSLPNEERAKQFTFDDWVKTNCSLTPSVAERLIKIFNRFGQRVHTLSSKFKDQDKLILLASLDDTQVDEVLNNEHYINGQFKTADDLNRAEFRKVVKQKKELEEIVKDLQEKSQEEIESLKLARKKDFEDMKSKIEKAKEEGKNEVVAEEVSRVLKGETSRLETEFLMKKKQLDDNYRAEYKKLENERSQIVSRIENVVARERNLSDYEIKLAKLKKEEELSMQQIQKLKEQYGVAKKGSEYIMEIREFLKNADLIIADMKKINSSPHGSNFLNDPEILPYIEFTLKQLEEELTAMSRKVNKNVSVIDVNFKSE